MIHERRMDAELRLENCYVYDFVDHKNELMSIDARDSTRYGRYINHQLDPLTNIKGRVYEVRDGRSHIIFRATKAIDVGDELFYDYNERDPDVIAKFPFLRRIVPITFAFQ